MAKKNVFVLLFIIFLFFLSITGKTDAAIRQCDLTYDWTNCINIAAGFSFEELGINSCDDFSSGDESTWDAWCQQNYPGSTYACCDETNRNAGCYSFKSGSCGTNKVCNNGYCCECTTGPCCDGCHFRPSSYICDDKYITDYGCPWGTGCGSDIGVRYKVRYCSGNSNWCSQGRTSSSWTPYSLYRSCGSNEKCVDDKNYCVYDPSCSGGTIRRCDLTYDWTNCINIAAGFSFEELGINSCDDFSSGDESTWDAWCQQNYPGSTYACCDETNRNAGCYSFRNGETCDTNGVCVNGTCVSDNQPPLVSIILSNGQPSWNPSTWTNLDVSASVSCDDDDGTGCMNDENYNEISFTQEEPASCSSQSYYFTENNAHFTTYGWICGRKKDFMGNVGYSSPIEVKIDKEDPVVNNPHPYQYEDRWSNTRQYISGSEFNVVDYPLEHPSGFRCGCWCEGQSCVPADCDDYNCRYTNQIALDHDMNTQINWKIYDYAGNSVSGHFTAKIDLSPPVTTDNYDGRIHGNGYTVTLTCTDFLTNGQQGSGCNETYYCVFDSGSNPCTPQTKGTSVSLTCDSDRCEKIIRYYSEDNVGNREEIKSSNVITLSTEVPSCEMQELPEYSGKQITLSWSGNDPLGVGIESYEIRYKYKNGEWHEWESFSSSHTSDIFTASEGDGKYSFECIATNNNDVEGSVSTPVETTVDTEPPHTYIMSPDFWNESSFIVSWGGYDNLSGISDYDVEWGTDMDNWHPWFRSTQQSNSTFGEEGVPSSLNDGDIFYFRVRARDNADNIGNWSSVNITRIDENPPECIIYPLPEFYNSTEIVLQWKTEDTISTISFVSMWYKKDNGSWEIIPRFGGDMSNGVVFNYTFYGENNHTYWFKCMARDPAGNLGWSQSQSTTIDISGPEPENMEFNNIVLYDNTLTVTTILNDANNIENALLFYKNTEIEPTQINKISNNRWEVTWSFLPVQTYGDYNFELMSKDNLGNVLVKTYSFSVHECTPGDERECGNNTGECKKGISVCEYNGTWGPCSGGIGPSEEVCDGKDNDCDGRIDNGVNCECLPGETQECGTDVGICKKGTKTCNSNGEWGQCVGSVEPQPETCNGLDDDCNGVADDAPYPGCCSPTDPPQPYGTSNIGICRFGEKRCIAGVWQVTKEPVYPTKEVCDNGLDDDCDGYADKDDSDCVSVSLCDNGIHDEGEEGIDCGGVCSRPCIDWTPFILIVTGSLILIVLAVAYFYFKSKGQELTWEMLMKKWT